MKNSASNDCFVVNNAEELLAALKIKASKILITKDYKKAFLEKTDLPLPEENLFSGTRIAASVGGNPVFMLMNRFSEKDKQQRKINRKVQKYMLKEYDADLLLYLRQLDY